MQIIVGMCGASGIIYGLRFLEVSKEIGIRTHLVLTEGCKRLIGLETEYSVEDIKSLASVTYEIDDMFAPIASGSFKTDGMVVIPCSMKTLAGIACGYSENLLLRAADVTIKEGRPLILVTRESPLSPIHLENMLKLARIGVYILPASPSFYGRPKTIQDLVNTVVGRVLDILKVEHKVYKRWGEEYEFD
ncbi:MAG: UbiX family flavin prenyltransferase [Nitrososphaerota archaeon]|nr:UbiX family flavin prenyltransferase [Nitrososphaerota archaeon]